MCIPAAVVAVGSLVMGAWQASQQSKAASAQADYQEDIGRYNARVAENQAQKTLSKGIEEENRVRQETAELLSRQRAALGASNVALGTGSPLQLQTDTLAGGEVDALRVRSNFQEQAEAQLQQSELISSSSQARSSLTRRRGRNIAAGTLLSSVGKFASSSVAGKWFSPNSAANQSTGQIV